MVVQLGERQTEDLDVAGSSPAHGTLFIFKYFSDIKHPFRLLNLGVLLPLIFRISLRYKLDLVEVGCTNI